MAKIDELLQELCPDGVEWKTLGEVSNLSRGKVYSKSYITNNAGSYPVYSSQTKNEGVLGNISTFDYDGEFLTWTTDGAYAGSVFHRNCKFSITNVCGLIKLTSDSISYRFLYYWLSIHAKEYVYEGMGNPKLMTNQMISVTIPLPPLPIQQHIVEVLDTFTDAISNLEEELALREKQFGFYREQLLSFDDEASLGGKLFSDKVEYVKLKDICLNICSGGTPLTSNKEYYSGSNPWLRTQEVDWNDVYDTELKISEDAIKNSSAKLIPANCLIVAMYGATAGKCCINRIPLTTNQACCNLQIDERKALVKYVFHWVCKEYHHIKAMGEGSQSNLNAQKVKSYPVPLPSISSQKEIVEILDTFESMIANIKEEIVLRTKQYEYYREKLLSFGN